MLDLLPHELIIEVFTYLPPRDLLELTVTCKLFNNIISKNSSLCNRLEVHFVPEHRILKWSNQRRYSRAYVEGSCVKYFREIFSQFGEHLKELQVICMKIEASNLKEILNFCVNLKKIVIKDNKISYNDEDFEEPLPRLKLNTLHYRNFVEQPTRIFRILKNCRTRELIVVGFTSSCCDLKNFITNQNDLKTISLHDANKNSAIFDEISTSINFKLSKLVLDKYPIENKCEYLEKFIANHVDTLIHLELNEVSQKTLEILRNCKKIKILKIFEMSFKTQTIMANVEHLTIGYDVTASWADNFPNCKDLKVTWIRFQRDLKEIEKLRKLKTLQIDYCCMPELSLPSVRTLKLRDVGFSSLRPFRLQNNAIEHLTLENCTHANFLIEFIDSHAKNLKFLRIKSTPLNDSCVKKLKNQKFVIQIL